MAYCSSKKYWSFLNCLKQSRPCHLWLRKVSVTRVTPIMSPTQPLWSPCSVLVKLLLILTQNLVVIEQNISRAADPSTNIDLICVPDNHYVLCPTQQHRCSTLLISCFDRCLCLFSLFCGKSSFFFSCYAFVLLCRFLLLVPLTYIMSQCSSICICYPVFLYLYQSHHQHVYLQARIFVFVFWIILFSFAASYSWCRWPQ